MFKEIKRYKYSSPYLVEFKIQPNKYTAILRRFNSKVVIATNAY